MKQTSQQQISEHHCIARFAPAAAVQQLSHKHHSDTPVFFRKNLILSAIACIFPNVAWALPESGQVVAGAATISSPDASTTLINQTTNQSIINWTRFNIGNDEFVQFIQPSTSSISLNRVVGGDPSSILGNLSANGHVYLVNPNGIYFGDGVQVDVSGLVASVLDINNDDFMAGNFAFSRDPAATVGSVINDGIITARDNGYVVLMGDYAANNGIIQAHMGKVVLASGSHVTMDVSGGNLVSVSVDEATVADLAGVENTGEIYADGGRVIMTAKVASDLIGSAVNNDGLVQAHSIVEHDGAIFLVGEGGDVTNSGTLDASAETGSGLDGGGVLVYSDKDVTLSSGAEVAARGDGSGSGGVVRVIAEDRLDHQSGALIDVSGGDHKGGFVEVSGHSGLAIRGEVSLGSGGSLLIDPAVLNIQSGSSIGFSTSSAYYVGDVFIENQLNANNNVTLVASDAVNVSGFVSIFATGTGNLAIKNGTLNSSTGGSFSGTKGCFSNGVCFDRTGGISGAMFTPSASGDITLSNLSINIAGGLTIAGGTGATGNVAIGFINTGGNVSITAGGNITVSGVSAAGTAFVADAGNDVTISGNMGSTDSAPLDANVTLRADNNVNINGDILLVNNNLTLAADNDGNGTGDVNINGQSGQMRTITTQGALNVSGQNFNVIGANTAGNASTAQVFIEADDNNALTSTDNVTINLAGVMNLTAGTGVAKTTSCVGCSDADVSVTVHAGNDISVTATTLNVEGGTVTATNASTGNATLTGNANASLIADRDIALNVGVLNVLATGTATARVSNNVSLAVANANATIKAGRNINATVTAGDITVTGGTAIATELTVPGCDTCSATATAKAGIEAGTNGQMVLSATGGNILLTPGAENSGFPSAPTTTVANADAYLSAGDLSAVAGTDINLSGSLINTGAAGGSVWFLDAANDIIVNTDIGATDARFDDALTLSAGNNVDIRDDVWLSNHTLTLIADDDAMNGGDVKVTGQTDESITVETQGALNISGQNFNVIGATSAGSSNGLSRVSVRADDGNATTTTDNITVTVANNMNVTGGTGTGCAGDCNPLLADVSVNVTAGNNITVNAGSLNITGGKATGSHHSAGPNPTAKANATVNAVDGNITLTLSGDLNIQGGTATANASSATIAATVFADANAALTAGGTATVNAAGSVLLSSGTVTSTVSPPITAVLNAGASVTADVLAMTAASNITANSATLVTTGDMTLAAVGGAYSDNVANSITAGNNLSITAGTNLTLNSDVDVSGSSVTLSAGGDLTINTDLGIAAGTASTAGKAAAASIPLNANTSLVAGNNILLNGNIFTPNNSLSIISGANISGTAAQILASGLYINAVGNINLSGTYLGVGGGTVAGVSGDTMILQAMQASGIPLPATTSPNAKLVSGGFLDIGTIALQSASSYLWLVGNETTVGAITAPSGARLLLQYSPSNPASAIGLEELPDTSQTVNYNNLNNIFPYPVTTLVIGSSLQTGDITIGSLGEVDLGSANIVAISTGGGQVDSLSNVITTGIVAGIQSASVFVTPTQESMAIEVEDPEYLDDDEERKKLIALADDGEGNSQMCAGQ